MELRREEGIQKRFLHFGERGGEKDGE